MTVLLNFLEKKMAMTSYGVRLAPDAARVLHENTRGKQIFAGANICFKILVANASINFSPHRISSIHRRL
jgi:hypothetical protein